MKILTQKEIEDEAERRIKLSGSPFGSPLYFNGFIDAAEWVHAMLPMLRPLQFNEGIAHTKHFGHYKITNLMDKWRVLYHDGNTPGPWNYISEGFDTEQMAIDFAQANYKELIEQLYV